MDVEQELKRVLRGHDTVTPVHDPVPAVHVGMRRRRRRQRVQVASAALSVVGVALGAGLLVSRPSPQARPIAPATAGPTGKPSAEDLLPTGFTVNGVSFVGDSGWALGSTPCDGNRCLAQLVSGDGGATWTERPARGLPRTCDDAGCTDHVVLAPDGRVGYAFGSYGAAYITTNGGESWSRTSGADVRGLVVDGSSVVRVLPTQPGCAPACTFVVQTSDVGSLVWHTTYTSRPGGWVDAELARRGSRVALVLHAHTAGGAGSAYSEVVASRDSGVTWTSADEPCDPAPHSPDAEVDTDTAAVGPEGVVALLCTPRGPGTPAAVRLSSDGGRTFSGPRLVPGQVSRVAVVTPTTLVVAGFTDGHGVLLRSTDSGATWTQVAQGPPLTHGSGRDALAFDSPLSGTWVGLDGTTVWRTTDAGASWSAYPFAP